MRDLGVRAQRGQNLHCCHRKQKAGQGPAWMEVSKSWGRWGWLVRSRTLQPGEVRLVQVPIVTTPMDAVPVSTTLLTDEQEDLSAKLVCWQRQESG